jgi:hypothetical protein
LTLASASATLRSSGGSRLVASADDRNRPEGEASSGTPVISRGDFETVRSDRPAWPCSTLSRTNDAMEMLAQLCAEHGVSWPSSACGRISGSHCRSCGCRPSRPSRGRRRCIATMLSCPIPLRAWWGRYRGCAWGEVRRSARAAGQRAIAPSGRVEARALAGDDERSLGSRPRRTSRTRAPAIRARMNRMPTTLAGSIERPACLD